MRIIIIFILAIISMPDCAWAQLRGSVVRDGVVINSVTLPTGWTGAVGEWQPPPGSTVITDKGGDIGDSYDGLTFTKPLKSDDEIAADLAQKEINDEAELISRRESVIIRRMAIAELQAEGKIP